RCEHAGGIPGGRPAGGQGSPGPAVERADATQSRIRIRARRRAAQAAEDDAAARGALRRSVEAFALRRIVAFPRSHLAAELRAIQLTHFALNVPFIAVDPEEALGQLDRLLLRR